MLVQPLGVAQPLIGRVHTEDYRFPFWRDLVVPPHIHRFVEVYLVIRGSAVLMADDRRVPVRAGSLYFIPPGLLHWTTEPSRSLRRFNLCVRPSAVRRLLAPEESRTLLGALPRPLLLASLAGTELDRLVTTLEDVTRLPAERTSAYNAGLGYALALAYTAYTAAERSAAPACLHPAVTRALALMRGDGLCLSREDLASEVGLSASHLSRLFVRELGQELRQVRNRRRLELVLELVRADRARNLTEAAVEAGFGSYSQFHRVHTQILGTPPSKMRGALNPVPGSVNRP